MGTIINSQPKKPQLKLDKLWEQEVRYECIHFRHNKKIIHALAGGMHFYGPEHSQIIDI